MTIFKKIRFKNIMSYGNQMTEVELDKATTTLVLGANGHGKSVLAEVLTFTLFGKPLRNINIPNLINSVNNADLLVELEFSIGTSEYLIRRGLKPKIFEIFLDGKLIPQDAASKDYQTILENDILKMNYKTFIQIVIIGKASYKPFMSLTPAERRAIVEDLLDINIFSDMNIILKNEMTAMKKNVADVNYQSDLIKEKLLLYSDVLNESHISIQEQLDTNQKEIDEYSIELEKLKTEKTNLVNGLPDVSGDKIRFSKLKEKLDKLNEYATTFKTKAGYVKKDINFFESNTNCNTCTQEIDHCFKEETLKKKECQFKKYQDALKDIELEQNKIRNTLIDIDASFKALEKKKESINKLDNLILNHQNHIDSLLKYNFKISSGHEKKLQERRVEYDKIELEQGLITKNREELIKNQHLYTIANTLLKDEGIKSKIIKHYLPQMNNLINKFLTNLDFNVTFNLDENFNEVIKNKAKENFTYYSFSEGEKQRIDSAIIFTWRKIAQMKNSANTNLLFLDETFDSSLDSSGIEEFLGILSDTETDLNYFVISHRGDVLLDKFERILKVEMVNGFSKIKEVI